MERHCRPGGKQIQRHSSLKSLAGLGDDKKLGMGEKDTGDTARHEGSDQIKKAGGARVGI